MPVSTVLNSKIRLTMLCLSRFELYSRWVPLMYDFIGQKYFLRDQIN